MRSRFISLCVGLSLFYENQVVFLNAQEWKPNCYAVAIGIPESDVSGMLDFAESVLIVNKIDLLSLRNKPDAFCEVTADKWIKGITLIVAGVLLLRYPPPVRTWGIRLIEIGVGIIGYEYYDQIMDHLINNNIIDDRSKEVIQNNVRY